MKKSINVVWIKRDIRTQDHEPFDLAEKNKRDYINIYLFEPSIINHPDCSLRHLQFVYQSIKETNKKLSKYNKEIHVFHQEAELVFEFLSNLYTIKNVFSYQETGIRKTWNRDKKLSLFFKTEKINWKQVQKDGIQRGIKTRKNWDQKWYHVMNQPVIKNIFKKQPVLTFENPFTIKPILKEKLDNYPTSLQKPGEELAWKYLKSFCKKRGADYSKNISKPQDSRASCGRISPYLSWGNISNRQAVQFIKTHPNYEFNKRSFNAILTRLKWRDHFIQKFEVECDYESRCINKGFESLSYKNDENLILAWEKGTTGFPLIDASMRCLIKTGWINFRMRAMLVSFLCHHLDCSWKLGVYHMAKIFLDYEPGIHYTQFQMQAGTTGINTVRIYNPIKQSKDHDPDGIFIKKWVEELKDVPKEFIHEPWMMTEMDKVFYELNYNYKKPIINLKDSGKLARAKIWGHRKYRKVKLENRRIIVTHTRQ